MRTDLSLGGSWILRATGWAICHGGDRRERVSGREAVGPAIERARVEHREHDVVAVVAQIGACDANPTVLGDLARVTLESLLAERDLAADDSFGNVQESNVRSPGSASQSRSESIHMTDIRERSRVGGL
jgi:hypothetical protein